MDKRMLSIRDGKRMIFREACGLPAGAPGENSLQESYCQVAMKQTEPLLVQGYEGMKQREGKIPPEGRYVLKDAMHRLVRLYEATGRSDQAREWQQRLVEFEQTATLPKPATGVR